MSDLHHSAIAAEAKEPRYPLPMHMPQATTSESTVGGTSLSLEKDLLFIPPNQSPATNDVRLNKGFTAWSQVFVSFLLVFNGFGYFSSFGLFQSHWTQVLNASPSDIAWVGSLSLFLLFFLGALSGPLMDRGHFHSIVFVGCAAQLLGVFSTSAVSQYWQLILAQGFVQGIGNGLLFTPCVTLVSIYFTKNRAFALSLAACGAPLGGIIFPLITRQLSGPIGYPWTIRIMGFIMTFNTILIFVLGRPRKFKKDKRPLVDAAAFKEPVYSFFAVGVFFTLWGIYIAYFYTSTYGRDVVGISESNSLTLLIILNAVGVPGRVIPAFLADRYFGLFNTMLPFVVGAGVLLLAWMRVESAAAFYAWVALYGICANAVQTLFPSTLSSLVTDLSKTGQRVGMVFSVGSLACLTGPPLAGVLIGVGNGSYKYLQIFGGVSVLVGFVFFAISRFYQTRGRM
ncbi:MFS monocarboxylate transporter-like protein [Xylaria castorea]|nr:MFS monocarboxylate transporter-like protein [Xylaria castorea]